MSRSSATKSLTAFACMLLLGCTSELSLPADLETVDHPDLSAIEETARRQLVDQKQLLASRLDKAASLRELADAFGGMGELYHAYELLPAAAASYRNAERLDAESFLWPYYLGALHQAAGDLTAATTSLERALQLSPEDLPARRRLAEIQLAKGETDAARTHFEALLDDSAYAAAGHFGLGRVAATEGNFEEAAHHFEQTLELQPNAGIVRHPLGLALRNLERPEDAEEYLEAPGSGEVLSADRLMERIETLAVSSGAYLKRGNRALMSGRLDEAAEELRNAVATDPSSTVARRNLAQALTRLGKLDEAAETLREAPERDDAWIHVDLGNVNMALGRADQAAEAFEKATEIDSSLVVAHFNLANSLIRLERWPRAKAALTRVLDLEPDHRRARYLAAMALHHTGSTEDAKVALRSLLEEEPADVIARKGLATVLVADGKVQRAMNVYRQGLALQPPIEDRVELSRLLAKLAWRRSQRAQAIDLWQEITVLQPQSSQAFTDLANGLQLAGELDEARQNFGEAVRLDPLNTTARLSEANLWLLDGKFSEAKLRLEDALEVAPDHPGLNHTLARLLATAPQPAHRDGRRSLALARKAYGLEGSLEHAETVAMAFAELDQFEEAIKWQRGLAIQANRMGDRAALQRLTTNLRRYERRQKIRAAP